MPNNEVILFIVIVCQYFCKFRFGEWPKMIYKNTDIIWIIQT